MFEVYVCTDTHVIDVLQCSFKRSTSARVPDLQHETYSPFFQRARMWDEMRHWYLVLWHLEAV